MYHVFLGKQTTNLFNRKVVEKVNMTNIRWIKSAGSETRDLDFYAVKEFLNYLGCKCSNIFNGWLHFKIHLVIVIISTQTLLSSTCSISRATWK